MREVPLPLTHAAGSSSMTRLTVRGLGRAVLPGGWEGEAKHTWTSTRNPCHTGWMSHGGREVREEGANLTCSEDWKKADVAEPEDQGESGRRQGQKGRQGQGELVTTTTKGLADPVPG